MHAALIFAAVVLVPGTVFAQGPALQRYPSPFVAPPPAPGVFTPPDPTPPAPTIPSAPSIPLPSKPADRPTRLFDFHPRATLSEEWTDNFFRSDRNPESNLRSSIAVGAQVLLDDPTLSGEFSYAPRGFYDTLFEDFGLHHGLAARLAWQATPRFKLTSAAGFSVDDEPAQADRLDLRRARREFTRTNGTVSGDYSLPLWTLSGFYRVSLFSETGESTLTHTSGADVTRLIGRTNSLTGAYRYLNSTTETDRRSALVEVERTRESSTDGHEFIGTFARELTSTTTVGLSAAYAVRSQVTQASESDYSRWNVSLFNTYSIAQRISLEGSIGIAQLMPSSGDPLLTWTSDTSLAYYFGPAVLRLTIERGFSETFGDGQNFGVVETSGVAAWFSYDFTPRVSANASGRYRENVFTGIGGGVTRPDENTLGFAVGLTYEIASWLNSSLDYSYTVTESAQRGGGGGYTENRVRAALNAVFFR